MGVFFYLEDRERTLNSPTDKIMLSLTSYADELEREKARQRPYDAMVRKARGQDPSTWFAASTGTAAGTLIYLLIVLITGQ